ERQQFGQPIGAFQGIQFMLADMAMAVHASRLMIHYCARQVDAGITGNAYEASMAKCFAADTAMKVTTDAVQIFGGYGYTREFPSVHTGCVAVTTALAVGEAAGASGRALLEALVAAVEVMCRVGLAVPGALHARHFHPTAIAGGFGAVAAAGKLQRLTEA